MDKAGPYFSGRELVDEIYRLRAEVARLEKLLDPEVEILETGGTGFDDSTVYCLRIGKRALAFLTQFQLTDEDWHRDAVANSMASRLAEAYLGEIYPVLLGLARRQQEAKRNAK